VREADIKGVARPLGDVTNEGSSVMKNLCAAFAVSVLWAALATATEAPLWKPVKDAVFLQEINQTLPTESPVTAIALQEGHVYALLDGTLHRIEGDRLTKVEAAPRNLTRLEALDDALWATTENATHRFSAGNWDKVSDLPLISFCMHNGTMRSGGKVCFCRRV